ncbi:DUF6586 family protein [Phytohalomonas tamaricis]|uniref:DUF6586 family protein n=1 Tax=Phytohalomonas tamaricis TaxID=2081032 RepID=UPI000D0B927B|nr:DUF6586 family protein [Phytohalomonas tamaricis]
MSARSRTNQLLYQAELLLAAPLLSASAADEHHEARRMACEEGAVAMLELALASLIAEVCETCRWTGVPWREVLEQPPRAVAEIERLRMLLSENDSWLARLLANIDKLHGSDGVARREQQAAVIVTTQQAGLSDEVRWYIDEFRRLLPELRETGVEW